MSKPEVAAPTAESRSLPAQLRRSLAYEPELNQDIEALLERLRDKAFASRLAKALTTRNSVAAMRLVQGTANSSSVHIEISPPGDDNLPPKGHICWHRNGVRKCLWYDDPK